MELIRPGVRDDIDLTTTGPSHVRRVTARLHLEFSDCIRRRTKVLCIEGRIGIRSAVQQEEVSVRAASSDYHRGALARPPVQRIR